MPAIRTSARSTTTLHHDIGPLSPYGSETQLETSPTLCAGEHNALKPPTACTASKKRRPPNAFILFRSYIIANKLYPPEIKHQNDVSRFVAELWRSSSASERAVFFRKAEDEKLRYEVEGPGEAMKKKRTRTRKLRPSKAAELNVKFYVPQRPTSDSEDSTSRSLAYGFSPGSGRASATSVSLAALSAPIFESSAPPSNVSVPPLAAPQPILAIPPTLFNWSPHTDSFGSDIEGRNSREPAWSPSSHPPSFLPAYSQNDLGSLTFLDNAFQLDLEFLLSSNMAMPSPLDTYFDFLFPFTQMPSLEPCTFSPVHSCHALHPDSYPYVH